MRTVLGGIIAFLLLMSTPAPALADAPFALNTTPGSLPRNVVPVAYDISLQPNVKAFTVAGTERVSILVHSATATITVNTHNLVVTSARIDGAGRANIAIDNDKEQTRFTFPRAIKAGQHVLALEFKGHIDRTSQGLFAVTYGSPPKTMLATQFESTDARRVFPCWDEPVFKATFRLHATLPARWLAVSNTPIASQEPAGDGFVRTTFEQTPRMSSYLLVLCAGDLETIGGSSDGVAVRIISEKGKAAQARYALESAKKILAYYDDYFGVRYPLPKLDLIAIPGGFAGFGAMENWGGITYDASLLLFDPANDAESKRQDMFNVIAHEMAHQWFGDLVTMAWWDNIWLNEGFASWMATKATDHFNPSWHVWEDADSDKSAAMESDGRVSTHAIQQAVTSPAEIDAAFDDITYLKGQSFLRMLETYLGAETFRTGIRSYIKAHAYSSATTGDLWAALGAASNQPVGAIASSWTAQPGYPLVSVHADCTVDKRTLHLSQQRFYNEPGPSSAQRWQIPLDVRTGSDADASITNRLFNTTSMDLGAGGCNAPYFVNPGDIGFYRVAYDDGSFASIRDRFASLPVLDKLVLLGDAGALTLGLRLDTGTYLSLAGTLRTESNENVWARAIGTLQQIGDYERGQPGEAAYKAYVRRIIEPAFATVGWDAKPEIHAQRLQAELIAALGAADDPEVVAESQKRFQTFLHDPQSLPTYLRRPVVRIVARNADGTTYDRLRAQLDKAKGETEVDLYLYALAMPIDDALARRTLNYAASAKLPAEAGPGAAFWLTSAVAVQHPKLAFDFAKNQGNRLITGLDPLAMSYIPTVSAARFWRGATDAQIAAYIHSVDPKEPSEQVDRAMESLKITRRRQAAIVPATDRFVATSAILPAVATPNPR